MRGKRKEQKEMEERDGERDRDRIRKRDRDRERDRVRKRDIGYPSLICALESRENCHFKIDNLLKLE